MTQELCPKCPERMLEKFANINMNKNQPPASTNEAAAFLRSFNDMCEDCPLNPKNTLPNKKTEP